MPHWLGWTRMMKKFGNYNMKPPSDLWFSDADSLPWFLKEMGLRSCYDACYHEQKLIEKYGIRRRDLVGYEYGHHFVFVDKEKFDRELKRFNDELASFEEVKRLKQQDNDQVSMSMGYL